MNESKRNLKELKQGTYGVILLVHLCQFSSITILSNAPIAHAVVANTMNLAQILHFKLDSIFSKYAIIEQSLLMTLLNQWKIPTSSIETYLPLLLAQLDAHGSILCFQCNESFAQTLDLRN